MNTMTDQKNLAVTGKQKMTPSEAFVETLVANGVTDMIQIALNLVSLNQGLQDRLHHRPVRVPEGDREN